MYEVSDIRAPMFITQWSLIGTSIVTRCGVNGVA